MEENSLEINGASLCDIAETNILLSQQFQIKDMGNLNWFLGIKIEYDEGAGDLKLTQESYIKDLLKKCQVESCRTVQTPSNFADKITDFVEDEDQPMRGNVGYREIIGSLMYLMVGTRPDIAFIVSKLSQYIKSPKSRHWNAVMWLMRYLASTSKTGIRFRDTYQDLLVYCDADWGGDMDTRRSMTGYVCQMSGGPISWAARRQGIVASSSTEAEYMALYEATVEVIWLRRMLEEITNNTSVKE
jgi:hypothetical protein